MRHPYITQSSGLDLTAGGQCRWWMAIKRATFCLACVYTWPLVFDENGTSQPASQPASRSRWPVWELEREAAIGNWARKVSERVLLLLPARARIDQPSIG